MPEHLVFQGLEFLKLSGGGLENIIVPNVFTPYEDRLSLYYPTFQWCNTGNGASCRRKFIAYSQGGKKQLLFFFDEGLGSHRCRTKRQSQNMESQTHALEQGLCWSPEPSWGLSSWAGRAWESGRDSSSEVESDAKSQNGYLFHVAWCFARQSPSWESGARAQWHLSNEN